MMGRHILILASAGLTASAWLSIQMNPTSVIANLFVCTDLLILMTAAALPAAMTVHWNVRDHLRRRIVPVCWMSLMIVLTLLTPGFSAHLASLDAMERFAFQLTIAFCIAFPLGRIISDSLKHSDRFELKTINQTTFGFSMIAALLILLTTSYSYRQFLVRHYVEDAKEYLGEQRIVKANNAMQVVAQFDPMGIAIDEKNALLARKLQQVVESEYQGLLQRKRPNTNAEVGELIQALLRLDELELAERQLAPMLESTNPPPVVWDTLGVLRQRQTRWTESKAAYQKAAAAWSQNKSSAQYQTGLASAYRGIAFAEWQLGDNRATSEAYEKLVAIAPTADNHLLAARFYEQAQQTNRSFEHARKVLEVGSKDQVASANEIIRELENAHFGCFQIYRQRGTR